LLDIIYKMQKYRHRQISIDGRKFDAIISDSFAKRMIGLMFRESIPKSSCMLFIFGGEGMQGIWMRNMRFAIDVIWLDGNCRIVGIEEDLQPCGSMFGCRTYYPKSDAKYIIEMPAGSVSRNRIRKGSKISLGFTS
jgi:uncharacterized protein